MDHWLKEGTLRRKVSLSRTVTEADVVERKDINTVSLHDQSDDLQPPVLVHAISDLPAMQLTPSNFINLSSSIKSNKRKCDKSLFDCQ